MAEGLLLLLLLPVVLLQVNNCFETSSTILNSILLPHLAAAPAEKAKPKEEEVDALDGGMDMFGGNFNRQYHHLSIIIVTLNHYHCNHH